MPIEPKKIQLRWSDLDPNFHLRHSAFYDLASQYRMDVLDEYGVTLKVMEEQYFAPVILREECVFLREIRYADAVYINLSVKEVSEDGSKWQILHEFKDDKGKLKAKLTVDVAWLDIQKRRFVSPVPEVIANARKAIMDDLDS